MARSAGAACDICAGASLGAVSAGAVGWLAIGLGSRPAQLGPKQALVVGLLSTTAALVLAAAGGNWRRVEGAGPAIITLQGILMGPGPASVAGGVSLGLLWGLRQHVGQRLDR